jgi:hypothetical protein
MRPASRIGGAAVKETFLKGFVAEEAGATKRQTAVFRQGVLYFMLVVRQLIASISRFASEREKGR